MKILFCVLRIHTHAFAIVVLHISRMLVDLSLDSTLHFFYCLLIVGVGHDPKMAAEKTIFVRARRGLDAFFIQSIK